jgi:hydroxypyruvate reductase 1
MIKEWSIYNPDGNHRVILTKQLVGDRWLKILIESGCRVEACLSSDTLSRSEIIAAIGQSCAGAIGQLTEVIDKEVLTRFKSAGGRVYSNVAVGYDNVDVAVATVLGVCVGNTPGVLTETTAELAVALTFAVARRIAEGDTYMKKGQFKGWQLNLFLGDLLGRKTLGVIGMGRIGSAYARMMVEGHQTNLLYFDRSVNRSLETSLDAFNKYLEGRGEQPILFRRTATVEELLQEADIVSLHPTLNNSTHHLINGPRLALMKKNAILVNVSRGAVIDEQALVEHCRRNPEFRVGLDVYEEEPELKPGLKELPNVVLLPHIGSATHWTREAMSTIAARNIAAVLAGYPAWRGKDIRVFLKDDAPKAAPSIVNASELGM